MLKQSQPPTQPSTTVSGGVHSVTAALRGVATAHGIINPVTKTPYTEAMLLGLGGGLGAGYILWEFKAREFANIVLGFRYRWNYPAENLARLAARLGAVVAVQEFTSANAALTALQNADWPVIAWVDKAHMPYHYLPESLKGYISHVLVVREVIGDQVIVDDLASEPFSVPADIFAAGRARIDSDKKRLIQVGKGKTIDLPIAIKDAINECIEHLGGDSESFNLPAWKKWAKLLTHPKDKKGWPTVFREHIGLYSTLRSVFEGICLDDTEGQALRSMYADFLDEAADTIKLPALHEAAARFREVGKHWVQVAEQALPDEIAPFKATKALLRERYAAYRRHDLAALATINPQLEQQQALYDHDFPMNAADVPVLFERLSAALMTVYDAESAALKQLKAAMA
ncbi:MAG: DUF4872 domain-containing protein [Anaerolineae bacterium]|nr:DUF4872 domain-containing protein [Anaerolineae bacterium]